MRTYSGLICLLLLVAAILGAGALMLPGEKTPAFYVTRMTQPPVIDGAIGAEEWREAVGVSGPAQQNPGGNLLIMRPTTYFLGWDADNLYLACRTWIMPGYKPHVGGRAPNTANAFDDGMEFNLKPMGKNVSPGKADSAYKFFITCLGSTGDMARVSVGQLFRTWQPQFKIAYRLTPVGSAPLGGRWWECEAVLPAKDFDLDGPNRAGDQWKMLLAFNHMPGWMQAAIPISTGYFDASGFPTATLVDNTPAVQVTMDALPGVKDGVAAVKFNAYNPTTQPVTLNVLAEYRELQGDGPASTDLLTRRQTLTVEPGKQAEYALNEKFPREIKGNGSIYYQVTQGDKELYRYYSFFTLGYEERWVKYTPSKAAFELSSAFNPARNNCMVTADTFYLDDPASVQSVSYRVLRDGETKPLAEGSIDKVKYYYFNKLLTFPELAPGKYSVEATLRTKDGQTLGPVTNSFVKKDEAKEYAAWWKNKIGNTERVIPPFKPIIRQGNTVTLWGRSYRLSPLGLPIAVTVQEKPVLTSPARIVAVIGGKEQVIPLSGVPAFTETKAWRYAFKGTAKGAGLAFTASGTVEQDGLAMVTLTYAPLGKPVKLDALRLEFPIAASEADCLLCMGTGGNFASYTAMELPKDKQGRLWSTLDTGKGGALMTVGSFYPDVWVGNEQRGLLWWGDSDQGWVPDDAVPAHEVVRQGNAVVLRNNIIGTPYTLDAPRTLTFSYMASPFKPLVKGWRMALHSEDGTFEGPHKKRIDPKTGKQVDGWAWLNPPSEDPKEWAALWAEYKPKADARIHDMQWTNPAWARQRDYVHTSIPMRGYGPNTSDQALLDYFWPEWGEGSYGASQRDYQLWLADRAFREGGLRSIYWDILYVSQSNSLQTGTAYELPDGRLQPTYNGFNQRQFMMRLRADMTDCGLEPGGLVGHSTNCYPLVAYPWMDAILDGEWAEVKDSTPVDWVDQYSPARMRAMSVSDTWGVQVSWMSLFHVTDKAREARLYRSFIDYQRLHDTWSGQDGRVPPEPVLEWGINDERLQYIPYWRNNLITTDDKDVLVSLWRLPDRVLVVAFNNDGKQVKDVKLKVDLKGIGLSHWDAIVAQELGGAGDQQVTLTGTNNLLIPGLQPHTARYAGLCMFNNNDFHALKQFVSIPDSQNAQQTISISDKITWCLVSPLAKWVHAADLKTVICATPDIKVDLWQLPDRVLLAITNPTDKDAGTVTLGIDLDKLNLTPQLPWQEFIRVKDFDNGNAALDFWNRKLTVPGVKAHGVRFVGVRRY